VAHPVASGIKSLEDMRLRQLRPTKGLEVVDLLQTTFWMKLEEGKVYDAVRKVTYIHK